MEKLWTQPPKRKKMPEFMSKAEQDHCLGHLLSTALKLKQLGFKDRHIKWAALELAVQYAVNEGFHECRFFYTKLVERGREGVASLDQAAADYKQAEEEGRVEEYLKNCN